MEQLLSFANFGPPHAFYEPNEQKRARHLIHDDSIQVALGLDLALRPVSNYDSLEIVLTDDINHLSDIIQQNKKLCKKFKLKVGQKNRERNHNRSKQETAHTNELRAYNEAELQRQAYEKSLCTLNNDNNLLTKLNLIHLITNDQENLTSFYNYAHVLPGPILKSTSNLITQKSEIWNSIEKKRGYELEKVQV